MSRASDAFERALVQSHGSGRESDEERAQVDAEAKLILSEYQQQGVTMQQLADKYGVSLWVIDRRLRRARRLEKEQP